MTFDNAITVLQSHERARQGRLRSTLMRQINQDEKRRKGKKSAMS